MVHTTQHNERHKETQQEAGYRSQCREKPDDAVCQRQTTVVAQRGQHQVGDGNGYHKRYHGHNDHFENIGNKAIHKVVYNGQQANTQHYRKYRTCVAEYRNGDSQEREGVFRRTNRIHKGGIH